MTTAAAHLLTLLLATSGLDGAGPASTDPMTGVWPLAPTPAVVAPFDPPLSRYAAGHRGVDLAGTEGQQVRAAATGRVTFAGSLAGRGVVVVSHGATRTTYEPVKSRVEVGAQVAAGQVLGTLESFGSHCPPAACLHWGLIEGETYLDPLTLVGAGPVRLLPLYASGPVEGSRAGSDPVSGWQPGLVASPLKRGGEPAGMPGAAGRS